MEDGVAAINEPKLVIKDICPQHVKVTSLLWTPLNKQIIAGYPINIDLTISCEDGQLRIINASTGKVESVKKVHESDVTCLVTSYDRSMFATASKDAKTKVFDIETFEEICSFATDRPLNGVALSPIRDHLVVVGGVEARDVTTTHTQKMEVSGILGMSKKESLL